MTSGEFSRFPIDAIFVNREKRQRKELTGIQELANSISQVGLIHPPVIERSGELRVGERRWTAVKSLGWTAMPVQFVDELDTEQLYLLELEENIQRVNLPWQEECAGILEYHEKRMAAEENWSTERTADILGSAVRTIQEKMNVAKELKRGNVMVADAGEFSTARGITQRAAERRKSSGLASVVAAGPVVAPSKPAIPLLNGDFHSWASAYEGPKFNLIHCDFPYGINANKQQQGHQALSLGSYADGENVYKALLETLALAMPNVVADSAHIMFWFSMDYYSWTKNRLEEMGWAINPFPLIWHKDDNTGLLPDPKRGPRRIYETCFFGSRGDRPIVRAKSNIFSHPGKDKSIHMSEKPVPMLRYFMEMLVDEYSSVLDPTCGSANAVKAAIKLGAKQVLGIERDEEFFNRAVEAFNE